MQPVRTLNSCHSAVHYITDTRWGTEMPDIYFYVAMTLAALFITKAFGGYRSFENGLILVPIGLVAFIGAGAAMENDFISGNRYFDYAQFGLAMIFGFVGIAASCAWTLLLRSDVVPAPRTDIKRPADRVPTPRVDIHV